MSGPPVFEGYAALFKESRKTCNKKKELREYLSSEKAAQDFGLQNFNSMLSVGPGFGDMDALLIDQCPNLKEYTGIEPNSEFHEGLKNSLASYDSVKKTIVGSKFEDYKEESHFDSVFFIHSIYRLVPEELEFQLRRAFEMLNKNGKMVIIVAHSKAVVEARAKIGEKIKKDYNDWKDIFRKIDEHYKEIILDTELDFSDSGSMNHSFLDVALERYTTTEEKAVILEEISKYFVPGTKRVKITESISILSKN